MKRRNAGFTLVELIVVITILAILGTIAIMAFSGYSKNARDSARIADITNIKKTLELWMLSSWTYPLPTDGESVTYSWATVWTQGTFGDSVINTVWKLEKKPLDPLYDVEYTYSVVNSRKSYEIWTILEWSQIANIPFVDQTFAAENYKAYISGTYNGLVVLASTGSSDYILTIPTIISSDLSNLELLNIIQNKNLAFNKYDNIPYSYFGVNTWTWKFDFNSSNSSKVLVYSGSLKDEVIDATFLSEIASNIQSAYSGSTISNEKLYSTVLWIDSSDTPSVLSTIGDTIKNNIVSFNLDNIDTTVTPPLVPLYTYNTSTWFTLWTHSWTLLSWSWITLNQIQNDSIWSFSWTTLYKISPDSWTVLNSSNLSWGLYSSLVTANYIYINDVPTKKVYKIDRTTLAKVWEIVFSRYVYRVTLWKDWYMYAVTSPTFSSAYDTIYIEKVDLSNNTIVSNINTSESFSWNWYGIQILINDSNIAYITYARSYDASAWTFTYNLNTSTKLWSYNHSAFSYWYCGYWLSLDSSGNAWSSCYRGWAGQTAFIKSLPNGTFSRLCTANACWSTIWWNELVIDDNNFLWHLFWWKLSKYNTVTNTTQTINLTGQSNSISFRNGYVYVISNNTLYKVNATSMAVEWTYTLSFSPTGNNISDIMGYEQAKVLNATSGIYTSSILDLGEEKPLSKVSYLSASSTWTTLSISVWAGNTALEDSSWVWVNNVENNGSISSLGSKRYVKVKINMTSTDKYAAPNIENITIY